jgi:hypothetical protein
MDDLIEAAIGSTPCRRRQLSRSTDWCANHDAEFPDAGEECYDILNRRHEAKLMLERILQPLRDRISSVISSLEPARTHWIGCADTHELCRASAAIQRELA